jgi:hypothetical protein
VAFVADDLAAWLIFILAEGGRKKLTSLILGDDPERALRRPPRPRSSAPPPTCAQPMLSGRRSWR